MMSGIHPAWRLFLSLYPQFGALGERKVLVRVYVANRSKDKGLSEGKD